MKSLENAEAGFSKIKEVVASWQRIRQILRSGEDGHLVPVVIPKDRRGFLSLYFGGAALFVLASGLLLLVFGGGAAAGAAGGLGLLAGLVLTAVAALWFWRRSIVEIEQGTTGVLSHFGKIAGTMDPGRHYLWWPWNKVEFIVDTSTEIPYTAPVLACPTSENVPLRSIEFFLKFRIVDPVAFVRVIGASNFDLVLASAVQDAIRRRSRQLRTARAYDLRGGDVGDMQEHLNRQMSRYGVRVLGANIPDVQLPEQYQQNLATKERVAKELAAYEKEWELVKKQRGDALEIEIERAKKERDAKEVEVKSALNRAREEVARMLQERETEAERIRLQIEAKGRAELKAAENEAKALQHLGKAYKDNRAVLRYQLARRRLEVAQELVRRAPRPVLVHSDGEGQSTLGSFLLAQMLPQIARGSGTANGKTAESAESTSAQKPA